MAFAERDGALPNGAGMIAKRLIAQRRVVERHRRDRQSLKAGGLAICRAGVVAHHAQHCARVRAIALEGAEFARHLRRGGIGGARHDRRKRAADRAALNAVVRDAGRHQQPADIGVAKAQRAIIVRKPGDFLGRKLRHHDRDFEHDRP